MASAPASSSGNAWYSETQQRYTLYAIANCPASLYTSIMRSLRKSLSETSEPKPAPKFHTLLAHDSNSRSCVTPLVRVIASNVVLPGDFLLELGSPPSRCSI